MKFSIENKVLAGFTGTFLVLFITGWLLYKNNLNVTSSGRLVNHTHEVLYNVSALQALLADYESKARGAVLSEDLHYAEASDIKARQIIGAQQALKELTKDNALQQRQLDTLAALTAQKIRFMRMVLGALSSSGFATAKMIIVSQKGELFMARINRKLFEIRTREQELFKIREQKYMAQTARVQWLLAGLFAIIALILISMYIILRANFIVRTRHEESITRLNEVLEQHIGQLKIANKDLEAFTYSVSHDLRAPLRAINGYTLILSHDYGGKLDSEANRLMGIVSNNAKKMGQLIDDLLNFSRLGRTDIVKHPVVMSELVNDVVEELRRNSGAGDMELNIDELPEAYGDRSLLRQVWTNLISNAMKYTRPGVTPVIRINSYKKNNSLVYCITDNGVGFDMSFYNKLFGVFQRLHNADEFEGTGVGLAIVKRIIQKHKGEIWAEAKVNAGASFCFSIPN